MSSEPERRDKITLENLCFDCQDIICRYLPVPDLLNVADTSKQLKVVADLAFSMQYGSKILAIDGFTSRRKRRWFIGRKWLRTGNLKIMLQTIRCFGHLVSRMEIELIHELIDNIKLLPKKFERLIFYVKKYCVESLTEFTLLEVDLKAKSLHKFKNPFPNVHSVCVQSSDTKGVSLIKLFPKMRRLTYHCKNMDELASIERDLQNVDHLEIISECEWERCEASLQRSILHLRILSVPFSALFLSMFPLDAFSNLQELRVNDMPSYMWGRESTAHFHSKTVTAFSMYYSHSSIASFPKILFSFDNLKSFDLQFNATNTFNLTSAPDLFYDYISRHPTILKLRIINVPGLLSLHRLMNILPLLEEAELYGEFAIDDIIHFMNNMRALKSLQIRIRSFSKTLVTEIKDRLEFGNEWYGKKVNILVYKFTRTSKR